MKVIEELKRNVAIELGNGSSEIWGAIIVAMLFNKFAHVRTVGTNAGSKVLLSAKKLITEHDFRHAEIPKYPIQTKEVSDSMTNGITQNKETIIIFIIKFLTLKYFKSQ